MNRRQYAIGASALAFLKLAGRSAALSRISGGLWWDVPPEGRTIRILDYTTPEWAEAIHDAAVRWNMQLLSIEDARIPFFSVERRDATDAVDATHVSVDEGAIVIVSPTLNAFWNGTTQPVQQDRMVGAVITFDNYDYIDPVTGQPLLLYPDVPARRDLACHELGHALGVSHAPAGTGCGCMAEDRLVCADELGQNGVSAWTLNQLRTSYLMAQQSDVAE